MWRGLKVGVKQEKLNRQNVIKALVISAILVIIVLVGTIKVFDASLDSIKNFSDAVFVKASLPVFVTLHFYYSLAIISAFVLSIFIVREVFRRIVPRRIIRDKEYILRLFWGRGENSPAPTREVLIKNIYGEEVSVKNKENYNFINQTINNNVDSIKIFLAQNKTNNRLLCLDGLWGSGKTTSLLVAINESDLPDNRYIYEAAFKYRGNVNEYINDTLATLEDALLESGVRVKDDISNLIKNYDTNPKKFFVNFLKNKRDLNILTADFVSQLNEKYRVSECNKNFFVIIDDLDRLQGEDIVEVLSFLSMLRNLKFVRIIIPVDLSVVCRSLEVYKIIDPPRFIEKYLPYSNSIRIQSKYQMVEGVLQDRILSKQKKQNRGVNTCPAIAAVYIYMLEKVMLDETKNFKNIRYRWLNTSVQNISDELTSEKLRQLLLAPKIISKNHSGIYDWDTSYNNIQKFQNIVYALRVAERPGGVKIKVSQVFSESEYSVICNWIFTYMEKRWDIFGFTVRDAVNALDVVKYDKLPDDPVHQFIYVFNQLFPDEKLKAIEDAENN